MSTSTKRWHVFHGSRCDWRLITFSRADKFSTELGYVIGTRKSNFVFLVHILNSIYFPVVSSIMVLLLSSVTEALPRLETHSPQVQID